MTGKPKKKPYIIRIIWGEVSSTKDSILLGTFYYIDACTYFVLDSVKHCILGGGAPKIHKMLFFPNRGSTVYSLKETKKQTTIV